MGGPELAGNPTSSTPDLQVIAMTFSQYVANSMKEGNVTEHEPATFLFA